MINVVGAGEDPENLTPATFYNFTPKQKPAPEPVKPIAQPTQSIPQATPVAALSAVQPAVQPTPQEVASKIAPDPPLEPEPITQTPSTKPPQKPKKLLVAGIVGFLVLSIGISAAVYLGQTNQDVRQQASTFQDETLTVPTDVPTEVEPTTPPEPTAEPTQAVLDDVETLALGATLSPTPLATLTPSAAPTPILIDTTQFCGESCNTDENCENPTHVCASGKCKLSSNPVSVSCKTPSGSSQIQWDETQEIRAYSPYAALSGATPQSGPTDWLNYGWAGIGALGIGATLLLFL